MKNLASNFAKLLIAAVLVSVIFLLFYFNIKQLEETKVHNTWVTHTYEIMNSANILFSSFYDLEDYFEDYTSSRDEKPIKKYYESKEKVKTQFSVLRTLIANQEQRLRLDTLEKLYNRKVKIFDSQISIIYNKRNAVLPEGIYSTETDELKDSIRQVINNFNILEKELLDTRTEKYSTSHQQYFQSSILDAAVIIILFIGIFVVLIRQVNKKVKSEQELFIKSEWYDKTLMSIGDGVIATDKNGVISFVNNAATSIMEWEAYEIVGKHIDFIFEIFTESTGSLAENPLKKALAERKIFLLANHTLLKTKSGKMIYIEDSAAPVFDGEGNLIGGVLIFRDIYEKTFSLKQLAAEKQKLAGIIDNTISTVSIRDKEGKYILVNRQFENYLNVKQEFVIGKKMEDVLGDAESVKALTASDDKILKHKVADSFERDVKLPDGSIRTFLVNKFPMLDSDGNAIAICMMSSDITESKMNVEKETRLKYLEHVQRSELKFQELIQNMPVVYFAFDNELKLSYWNKTMEDFTGMKSKEVQGKSLKEIFPNDSMPLDSHCREVMNSKKPKTFIFDYTFAGKNYTSNVTIYPTTSGVAGISMDITDQRYAEKATKELIESLQKRNNELKQFAYIVSHNLRAPISKIQGLAALFDTDPDDETLNRTVITNIHASANDLDTVVKDINTVISTRESENEVYEYTLFDVELNLVKQILHDEIKKAGTPLITTDFHDPSGLLTVKSNIHIVLLNLLSNALKYRSPDRNLHVHFQTQQDSHYVNLIVEDNGIGIDLSKYGTKIFGLYKRFHSGSIEGRGLGLYLVKTQVESMDGKIEVESTVGKGTKFVISLPKKNLEVKNEKV